MSEVSSNENRSTLIVDDLVNGTSEWRNIEDIIRLTFKAMSDVLKIQGATLTEVEKQLPTRASKTELTTSLSYKVNINDLQKTINYLQSQLDSKVSFTDIQNIFQQQQQQQQPKDTQQQDDRIFQVEQQILGMKNQMEHDKQIQEGINHSFENKIGILQMTEQAKDNMNVTQLNNQIDKQEIQEMINKKSDRQEIGAFLEALNKKADMAEVQQLVREEQEENKRMIKKMKRIVKGIDQEKEEGKEGLWKRMDEIKQVEEQSRQRIQQLENNHKENQKGNKKEKGQQDDLDINTILNEKVDFKDVQQAFSNLKSDYDQKIQHQEQILIQQIEENQHHVEQQLLNIQNTLIQNINNNSNNQELDKQKEQKQQQQKRINESNDNESVGNKGEELVSWRVQMESQLDKKIDKQMYQKYYKRLQQSLSEQASIDEVNKALGSVHSEIDALQLENRKTLINQSKVNETICSENILARWICKTVDHPQQINLVPWEIQLNNTLPDNFIWQQNASSILVLSPGYYHILYAAVSSHKQNYASSPPLSLLVNGNLINTVGNNISNNTQHSVIQVQSKTKISLVYNSDHKVECILQIKRL